ncbi:MAG: DUF2851 family protein, partial [Nitrospirae bacterium]|nr:DUF2851 family protein [Nitrospirota bacterium]
ALYREIMLALGYKNNKVQFLELSTIMPYSEIKTLKNQDLIAKALLYRAGFSKDKDGLSKDFNFSLKMDKSVWNYKDVRPINFPENRIKNISVFLAESCKAGGLENIFRKRIEENYTSQLNKHKAIKIVQKIVSIDGIGKQRALEILFNIILPFYIVLFEREGQKQYIDFIERLYELHPPLSDNTITRAMKAKLKGAPTIGSVKQYMGLIELYNQEHGASGDDT